MGTMHKVSAYDGMVLPVGTNMTNGARILSDGNDCLEDIGKMINDLFNWFMPTAVLDMQIANPWACSNGEGEVTFAEYMVPTWTVGVGGSTPRQYFLGHVTAETTGTAVGRVRVYASESIILAERNSISGTPGETTMGHASNAAWCNNEIVKISVTGEVTSGTGDLNVEKIRLEYKPFTNTLPDGPYAQWFLNEFLPVDVDHFGTDYYAGTVERIRRMLVNLMELIRRRTPQPIVTWSNIDNPFSAGGAKTGTEYLLCRLLTDHLPFYERIVIYAKYTSSKGIRIELDDEFVELEPISSQLAFGRWRRVELPVDMSDEPGFTTREFRVIDLDSGGDAEVFALSAYWDILG